ncbi:MAG: hypothetical protein IJT02_01675 [Synergistaceae bacterium]|nr:hypothetical protein [Synergistaceae bacterium]
MPEDLDPTTARLVSELAAVILPSLTKSLAAAVPAPDLSGVIERTNRASQDMKAQLEKVIRADIEENRAGRSIIMQSISSVLEDIAALKRTTEKLPTSLTVPQQKNDDSGVREVMKKLDGISSQLEEVIHGLKSFAEAYAGRMEQTASEVPQAPAYSYNEAQLEKLITQSLPGLEGFVRANAKSQSQELEDFSREISALHEQSGKALVHEVSGNVSAELSRYGAEMLGRLNEEREGQFGQVTKTLKVLMMMSGASIVMSLLALVLMLFR